MSNRLTDQQIAEAKRLRSMGRNGCMDWARVARALGVPTSRLRAHFEAGYSATRNAARNIKSKYKGSPTAAFIPDYVLAERDQAAQAQHKSLTALLLGDPVPGRSALDRRGAA